MTEAEAHPTIVKRHTAGHLTAQRSAPKPVVSQAAETATNSTTQKMPGPWKQAGQRQKEKRVRAVVKGPIRCHNCQLMCVDAEHYLTHECGMRQQIHELRDR
jgi:hypothetical protein